MARRPFRNAHPTHYTAEGNNGGSYITISDTDREGIVYLEVGETCIRTIAMDISVVALAAILSHAKYNGFEKLLAEYENGSWADHLNKDPIADRNQHQGAFK